MVGVYKLDQTISVPRLAADSRRQLRMRRRREDLERAVCAYVEGVHITAFCRTPPDPSSAQRSFSLLPILPPHTTLSPPARAHPPTLAPAALDPAPDSPSYRK